MLLIRMLCYHYFMEEDGESGKYLNDCPVIYVLQAVSIAVFCKVLRYEWEK
jgi:hypothetical protein